MFKESSDISINTKLPDGLSLIYGDNNNALTLTDGTLELSADLSESIRRLRPDNLNRELLVKAAKIKSSIHERPIAIDATAGFGEDSLLLAAAGFEVHLYEYDAVIAVLLEDALRRAADEPKLQDAVSRMKLINTDSIKAMHGLSLTPDVVLLDPMFPAREKSALIKKKFQLLQKLEKPCSDETSLLEAAFAAKPHKIVIKRPIKGPFLADRKPDYSIKGKSVRYDCFVIA